MAATKKAPAKKSAAKKAAPAKKAAVKKAAPAQKSVAKKAAPLKKAAPAQKSVAKKAAPLKKAAVKKAAPAQKSVSKKAPRAVSTVPVAPAVRGRTKDGISYTKDFDVKFLKSQRDALFAERERLVGQADQLDAEAHQLIEEAEMGDVQFDDEGGEGDTMVVERERDLALSAQARESVQQIDEALARMEIGTYGYSVISLRPIPRERLEAIPWATELVEEKVGGIGRR
jgi:RNA polymerase-binding transcription factor DksA